MKISVRLPLTVAVLIGLLLAASFFGIYRLQRSLQVFEVQVAMANQQERLSATMLSTFKTQVQE